MRRLTAIVMMTVVAFSLSACGRKGRPIPPDGTINRVYPEVQFPKAPGEAETLPEAPESTTR
ncbi:MAG: lipoprotein [Rhodospirillaceae bacterium]|nr:lipoprotein [Rhodospirillales bacterium]